MFDREHLGKIRNALMEASYTHPQIHTVWDALIRRLDTAPGALEVGLMDSSRHVIKRVLNP